jgi:hypothetical protein
VRLKIQTQQTKEAESDVDGSPFLIFNEAAWWMEALTLASNSVWPTHFDCGQVEEDNNKAAHSHSKIIITHAAWQAGRRA